MLRCIVQECFAPCSEFLWNFQLFWPILRCRSSCKRRLVSTVRWWVREQPEKARKSRQQHTSAQHCVAKMQCGCNIYLLHRFPADTELRHRLAPLINRIDFVPTTNGLFGALLRRQADGAKSICHAQNCDGGAKRNSLKCWK